MSNPATPSTAAEAGPTPPGLSVSTGDLAFVLQVLIPRVWVRGPEVDALVDLRTKLEAILEEVDRDPPA